MSDHLARAWTLYELGRPKQAIEEARQHLALDAKSYEAHRLIAHCAAESGDADQSLHSARESVGLAPDYPANYLALAVAEQSAGHTGLARTAIAEALRLDPNEGRYHSFLASHLVQQLEFQDALHAANDGLRCDPKNVNCHFSRSFALFALKQLDAARDSIETGLSLDPNHSNLLALKGCVLTTRGKADEALPHLLESLRIDPQNTWAIDKLAEAQSETGIFARLFRSKVAWAIWLFACLLFGIFHEASKSRNVSRSIKPERAFTTSVEDLRKMDPRLRRALFPEHAARIDAENAARARGESPPSQEP